MKRTELLRTTWKAPVGKPIKKRRPRSTPARKESKGMPCMIRLPGCDGGGETTVLAHYRLAGYCGTGIKPPDEMGAFACVKCHDACDGRRNCGLTKIEIRLYHAEGVMRTQQAIKETHA